MRKSEAAFAGATRLTMLSRCWRRFRAPPSWMCEFGLEAFVQVW